MAEPTAGDTGTQTKVADTDAVVLETIGKGVITLGHGTDEDTDALLWCEVCNIVAYTYDGSIETESDLAAVGRKMVGDGVLDDLE